MDPRHRTLGLQFLVSFGVDEKPIAGSEFSGTVRGERLGVTR